MSYSQEQNQQRRIEEIEAEIEHEFSTNPESSSQIPVSTFSNFLTPIKHWFQALPNVGKILVVFTGFMMGLSLLTTVFKIVTALISLVIIGVCIYFGYQFLIKSN